MMSLRKKIRRWTVAAALAVSLTGCQFSLPLGGGQGNTGDAIACTIQPDSTGGGATLVCSASPAPGDSSPSPAAGGDSSPSPAPGGDSSPSPAPGGDGSPSPTPSESSSPVATLQNPQVLPPLTVAVGQYLDVNCADGTSPTGPNGQGIGGTGIAYTGTSTAANGVNPFTIVPGTASVEGTVVGSQSVKFYCDSNPPVPTVVQINVVPAANVLVTFFGWGDNTPPQSAQFSYVTSSNVSSTVSPAPGAGSGGPGNAIGTWNDPIPFGSDKAEYAPGTIIWIPMLQKYFIMDTDCAACDAAWSNGQQREVALWTGMASASNMYAEENCETFLDTKVAVQGSPMPIIVAPPSNEPVNNMPLFNNTTNACFPGGLEFVNQPNSQQVVGYSGGGGGSGKTLGGGGGSTNGIHVVGANLVDASGKTTVLHGVDKMGSEYACIQGFGIFDPPSADPATIVKAMKSWTGLNAVRVPLNEDCWLGINGVATAYAGPNYQQAIQNFVTTATQNNLVVILDLHWAAPGTTPATSQLPMPDLDHSITFWTQVATVFGSNGSVIFDLYNEPYPDNNSDSTAAWTCWKSGGTCSGVSYPVAGMQQLVTAVRGAGATNVLMLGGVEYSNSLTNWLSYEPTDPLNNLAASWHVYGTNACGDASCWSGAPAQVLAKVPVIVGEFGVNPGCSGTSSFDSTLLSWLDTQNASYLAWDWDAGGTGCSLVTDETTGAPSSGVGTFYPGQSRRH